MQIVDWLKKYKSPGAAVLMYHRIANCITDPWQLSVNPVNFEEQVLILMKSYNVVSLQQFVAQIESGRIKSNTVLITFDDAYADNYYNARPILEKYDCPATFFVPSAFIGKMKYFWWDELEQVILHSDVLPIIFSQSINGHLIHFNLGVAALSEQEKSMQHKWKWPDPAPGPRCELYLKIWESLKPLPYQEIEIALHKIRKWANTDLELNIVSFPMNDIQLKEIADHPLFSLGIHTHTHPALTAHGAEYQEQEILNCKNYLQREFGLDADTIAYPYGDCNEITINLSKKIGLRAGFTTNAEIISKKSNPMKLGRYQVLNWNGKDFSGQMANLLSS